MALSDFNCSNIFLSVFLSQCSTFEYSPIFRERTNEISSPGNCLYRDCKSWAILAELMQPKRIYKPEIKSRVEPGVG